WGGKKGRRGRGKAGSGSRLGRHGARRRRSVAARTAARATLTPSAIAMKRRMDRRYRGERGAQNDKGRWDPRVALCRSGLSVLERTFSVELCEDLHPEP